LEFDFEKVFSVGVVFLKVRLKVVGESKLDSWN